MEVSVKNLVKRGETYYFRCRLPNYSGEIKLSLKTCDLKKAVTACKLATERLNVILSGNWQMIPLQNIRRMIADSLIKENLTDRDALLASYGRLCESTRKDGAQDMLHLSRYIETALLENDLSAMNATAAAADILQNAEHDTTDIALAAREYLRAQLYLARTTLWKADKSRMTPIMP